MELIQNNPYRIAGIFPNATTKELEKQKGRIRAFAKVGREIKPDFDFQILKGVDRTEDSVNKAFSSLEQNKDRVNYSLFWFLNSSPFDNIAFKHLKSGDEEKAIEIWEKVTTGKDINSKNFSAFNNLGTYKLLSNNKSDIKTGIEFKIKLIESDYFENFVYLIADKTYTIDNKKQSEEMVDELLNQFKNRYSSSEIVELFSGCSGTTQKYLSKKITEEPIYKIENQIESCKKKRKVDKGNAYKFGLALFTNTKEHLSLIKSLLGTGNLKYKSIADQLANEIMQFGIDYFNESQENDSSENYLEYALKLTKLADSIAVGELAKDRVRDSLATLEKMKDRELDKAIEVLNSIKSAYEKACSEIDKQVAKTKITMSFGQTINYSKVDKAKANCLNWDKVLEFITNGISVDSIGVIKRCSNQNKVSEYKSLVDFLFDKLGPIQINKVKYLCYWKDLRAIQAKAIAKKVSSTRGCYIATMVYGDYNHPQVLELRRFRDNFLSKTIIGKSFIKLYYKYSPKLVERLKNKRVINLIIRKGLDQFIKLIRK